MSDQEPLRRLFFGVPIPAEVRRRLADARDAALAGQRARAVPEANFHVTLAFLGETPQDRLPCIRQAASRVTFPPFQVTLDHLHHKPRNAILWVGAAYTPGELAALVRDLNRALQDCHHTPDPRPYTPPQTQAAPPPPPPRPPGAPDLDRGGLPSVRVATHRRRRRLPHTGTLVRPNLTVLSQKNNRGNISVAFREPVLFISL
jgi:2'-5' RNA ligase